MAVRAQAIDRIGELERRYVEDVLAGGFRTSAGSAMTQRLERLAEEVFARRYCIALVNGTVTLHAALVAADVGPGDEVIVPPLTMSSTAFAAVHAGATPVFADVDPATWTLDPASVAERRTEKTKAVIPVALFGLPADMDPLGELGLFVLEDAAQCFLGTYHGRISGSLGNASSFSLQSSKHLASGEGGLILTDDEELADRIRRFTGLGYATLSASAVRITRETIQDPDYVRHVEVGFNFRMPELCAAVALAQLERVEELVAVRLRAADALASVSSDAAWLVPQAVPAGLTHSYWTYALKLDRPDVTWHQFRDVFRANGGDGVYAAWRLSYHEPAFAKWAGASCPIAEALQPKLLQFKTNYWDPNALDKQVESLAKAIRHFA